MSGVRLGLLVVAGALVSVAGCGGDDGGSGGGSSTGGASSGGASSGGASSGGSSSGGGGTSSGGAAGSSSGGTSSGGAAGSASGGTSSGGAAGAATGGSSSGGTGGAPSAACAGNALVGSCQITKGACTDYYGGFDANTQKTSCETSGATWATGKCVLTATVGGCESKKASANQCSVKWFFSPITTDLAKAACTGTFYPP